MELESINCQACGVSFKPKRRTRRYCYSCDVNVREKLAVTKKTTTRTCDFCASSFTTTKVTKRFCSRRCGFSFHARKPFAEFKKDTPCSVCGTSFVPISKVNKTCSVVCSRKRSYQCRKVENQEKDCSVCGTKFFPKRVLDVCCSSECSSKRARKAQDKTIVCASCGENFVHASSGCPTRCLKCRDNPKVTSSKPCDYCGDYFTHANTDIPRFCSRTCSTNGINQEGLSNARDKGEVLRKMIEFIFSAEHTPTVEEAAAHAGVGANYHTTVLGLSIEDLFKRAGRINRSTFASKFEESVYLSLVRFGLKETDIERQKTFSKLYYASKSKKLRFDFYVKSLNLLVEADGDQHGHASHVWFDVTNLQASDTLKNAYAAEHGINLMRVPYSPSFKNVLESVSQLIAPFICKDESKSL